MISCMVEAYFNSSEDTDSEDKDSEILAITDCQKIVQHHVAVTRKTLLSK